MIYTSYFAMLRKMPENIIPISICGGVPSWYSGLQYKKLAPKYDFFMEWKRTRDNDYYVDCYKEQITDKLDVVRVLSELQMKIPSEIRDQMGEPVWTSSKWNIALICYEKPSDFCHRHLVAEWLRDNGYVCTELRL